MKKILIILIVMLILSGCSSQSITISQPPATGSQPTVSVSAPTDSSGAGQTETTERIQRTLGDNTFIDAEVKIPVNLDIPAIDAELVPFDGDKIKKALFNNEVTTEKDDPHGNLITNQDGNSFCSFYTNDKDSCLHFRTKDVDYILDIFRWKSDQFPDNLSLFTNDTEFDFASREDAINAVTNVSKMLGVEYIGNASVYALDHQTLQSVEKQVEDSGEHTEYKFKEQWSKEDDCYFVMMDCVFQNIPVNTMDTVLSNNDLLIGTEIAAIYSKNGFEYFEVSNFYSQKNMSEPTPIVSLDDAIGIVTAKFESIITTSKYTITGIELKYVPQFKDKSHTSIQLIPVWYFTVDESYVKGGSTFETTLRFMLDAYTGKEM
ncbi:MAG: hypothetical protein ACM3S4_05070 [Burkholderiales bacterium]